MGNDKTALDLPEVSDALDGHGDPADLAREAARVDTVFAEAALPWRAAEALKALREQVNAAFPGRNKSHDGIVGDSAHQSRQSDHNPWIVDQGRGVVSAIDITHDPASGCDAEKIVAALHASRDARIKYLIWNRRIANASAIGSVPPWTWRSYTGANPHTHHFHLSVKADKALYDDASPWTIEPFAEAAPGVDLEREILVALSALGQSVEPEEPALPQLVAMQDALTQLFANQTQEWASAGVEILAEAVLDFPTLKPKYEHLFATAQVKPQWKGTVAWYLAMLRRGRARYAEVEAATGAPWWFVGIVHAMEASFSFSGHLHNGDPLTARTVRVPRHRPALWNPPSDWLSSAVDAITGEGHAHQQDWSLARALYRFERYNGFGYHAKGIPSPYLWSFSNHYDKGKYVADGRYDPSAVSKQCGAAVMLRALIDAGDAVIGE